MKTPAQYWNDAARDFDAIYSGRKSPAGRALDRWLRRDMYQRFDWSMQKAGDVTGKRICDVGCGSGRFVVEFAKRGAAQVTGVDVSSNMLALARQLAADSGVQQRCSFVESDVIDWQTDQRFDVTLAIGFWDYIREPIPRLQAIRAFTKEKFLSAWPRFWTWRMPVRKVRLQYLRGCPVYFFRRGEVVDMLKQSGFEVVSVETIGKLYCVEARPV